MAHKPTIKSLREQTGLARAAFARLAHLSDETQRKLEEGIPVSEDSANRALEMLNRLLHTSYDVENIDVSLL